MNDVTRNAEDEEFAKNAEAYAAEVAEASPSATTPRKTAMSYFRIQPGDSRNVKRMKLAGIRGVLSVSRSIARGDNPAEYAKKNFTGFKKHPRSSARARKA